MSAEDTDVAIIGAGPAGSAAAIDLTRRGQRVLLIDKRIFPRDKLCGGWVSSTATARIRALLGPHIHLPGVTATRVTFVLGQREVQLPARRRGRVALRSQLDTMLAHAAALSGAELRCGEAGGLVRRSDRFEVQVGDDQRVRARVVLLATGLGGLSERLELPQRPVKRRQVAQQWAQRVTYETPALGGVELHWLRGGLVSLAVPRDGLLLVTVTTDLPVKEADDTSPLALLQSRNPDARIWKTLRPPRQRQPAELRFPWQPAVLGVRNLLLIGDAAGYADAASDGIGGAFISAACAAEAACADGHVVQRYTALMKQFHRLPRRTPFIRRMMHHPVAHYLAQHWPEQPLRRAVVSGAGMSNLDTRTAPPRVPTF